MKKLLLITLTIVAISIFSCNKKDTIATTTKSGTTGPYTSLSSVFSTMMPIAVTATIDATKGGSVYGPNGTRFIFNPYSLVTASGSLATGSVQVKVTDYLSKGDMIFSGILPYSSGDPLFSGGEVNVIASQGGSPLHLAYNTYFTANMPFGGTPTPGLRCFIGKSISDTGQNKVNWAMSQDSLSGVCYNGDTVNIISDSLGLCNADRFMSSPNYQTFTVKITGVTMSSTDQAQAFVLYDNYKGVWPLLSFNSSPTNYVEHHVPNIPVHIVIFAIVNGNFYGGTLGVTPSTGSTYTVNVTQTDPISFKALVNTL